MKRLFVETRIFTQRLEAKGAKGLLDAIQSKILENPEAGDVMPGCGGVRKLRVADPTRSKGTRGGLRVLFLDLPHREAGADAGQRDRVAPALVFVRFRSVIPGKREDHARISA